MEKQKEKMESKSRKNRMQEKKNCKERGYKQQMGRENEKTRDKLERGKKMTGR